MLRLAGRRFPIKSDGTKMKHLLAGVLGKTKTAVHVALRKSKEPTHTEENKVGGFFGKHSVAVPPWHGRLAVIDLDQLPRSVGPTAELDDERMKPKHGRRVFHADKDVGVLDRKCVERGKNRSDDVIPHACVLVSARIGSAIGVAHIGIGSAIGETICIAAGIGRAIAFAARGKVYHVQVFEIASKVFANEALELGDGELADIAMNIDNAMMEMLRNLG